MNRGSLEQGAINSGRGSEQRAYDEYVEWNNRLQSQSSYEPSLNSVSTRSAFD
jgi:hypothetical protein